ncbi:S8 family serine peptidase [Amycolatopsis aidingensis]|uniref:S8 family serine peptidase n=1 Tax=Amycolatopsis aidingensis TaxID=2842453 RepID=UPI001C0CD60D|nr:S8 family serine peptidase [Amycolatopsis aidingensis]
MGSSRARGRLTGPVRRAGAVLLAATIGVLAPGVTPIPAVAQDDAADDGGFYAEPPPLPPGTPPPPDGGGVPEETFALDTQCVTRDLEDDIELPNKPWGQQYLRVEQAQTLARSSTGSAGRYRDGRPVKVAVIDTGVTPHPFFQDRLKGVGDYVKEVPPGPGLEDCDGHGTEVAGIIAANPTDPDIGFTGVAPDAEILSIRQSSQNYKKDTQQQSQPPAGDEGGGEEGQPGDGGESSELPADEQTNGLRGSTDPAQEGPTRQLNDGETAGNVDTLAQAIVLAANNDVDVMNVSINNCREANGQISEPERNLQAAVRYAVEVKDVVVVSAAGNTGEKCQQNNQLAPNKPRSVVTPPWFAEDVLSVAAVDENGNVAPFSVHGPWVSVAAPGTEIISLDPAKNSSKLANRMVEGSGDPMPIQGTSFAAPYVAGLAALVRTVHPDLDARQVMRRIVSTAQHPAAPDGRDNFIGYGIIDPMAALTSMVPEEEGVPPAQPKQLPSDMPPPNVRDPLPVIVAFAGAGGAVVALLIALFVVHTVRRNRRTP